MVVTRTAVLRCPSTDHGLCAFVFSTTKLVADSCCTTLALPPFWYAAKLFDISIVPFPAKADGQGGVRI